MSDLVGNPEDRFSHNEAQLIAEESDLSSSTEVINLLRLTLKLLTTEKAIPNTTQNTYSKEHKIGITPTFDTLEWSVASDRGLNNTF